MADARNDQRHLHRRHRDSASGGHARLWWNGRPAIFATTKTDTLDSNTFPRRGDPRFGAYRGKVLEIDAYVYQLQIETEKAELKGRFFK